MKIIIRGAPIAKARPRFFRRGNFVGTYNSQTTEEGRWLLEAKGQVTEYIAEGPIHLQVDFIMPVPKSTNKKFKRQVAEGRVWHIKRPDLDNLVKFIFDNLNGILWKDDSQVVEIEARKYYGEMPQTILEVYSGVGGLK